MKNGLVLLVIALFLSSCDIKNSDAKVEVEEGTQVEEPAAPETTVTATHPVEVKNPDKEEITKETPTPPGTDADLLGYWVGYFKKDIEDPNYEKNIESDAGFYWNRANKINISIDQIKGTMVIGHSVVAGNDRPFEGTVTQSEDGVYNFFVKEPGDHKYDGIFEFTIQDQQLIGTWVAYKNIDISKRKYTLEKKSFAYDPEIMLDYVTDFADWTKSREMQYSEDPNFDDAETWVYTEVASATGKIYEINASNTKLTKKEVENLQKGDLAVIRNTIYARHGYSFKNRPLRVFFDAQPWYVPVHADIKADFTNIEKENIALLLKYEENAAEYYDSFGR